MEKEYYEKNKEIILAKSKEYYNNHKDYYKSYNKNYQANLTEEQREKKRERMKLYRINNRELIKQKLQLKKKQKTKNVMTDDEKFDIMIQKKTKQQIRKKENNRNYLVKNREKLNEYKRNKNRKTGDGAKISKRARQELRQAYVVDVIRKHFKLSTETILSDENLIKTKTIELKVKRLLKQKQNEKRKKTNTGTS